MGVLIMDKEKEYVIRQLTEQILGELEYIELYCKKQREKIEEVIGLLKE
jgi:hypothetical protein